MTENNQLKIRQICLFFIAFVPVTKLFSMPSIVSKVSGQDIWISALLNIFIDLVTVVILTITCTKTNMTFYQLLEKNFGKTLSKIILFLYVIYFLLKSFLPISEQKTYVEVTLYETVPNILYFTPFLVVAFYLCIKKIRVLGRCADIMWIFTVIGYVLLFSLSISNADLTAVYPIGKNGATKILQGSYAGLNWYGDVVYLAFFIGKFKVERGKNYKIPLSYLLSCFMTLVFVVVFYCVFTSIAYKQRFALTETSKYTSVINSIGRFDYVGIILLLTTSIISLALPLYFATDILAHIFKNQNRWVFALIVVLLIFLALRIFGEYFRSVERFIISYGGIIFLIFGNVLPCLTIFMNKGEKSESLSL